MLECAAEHHGIEMTITACIDLNCGACTCCCGSICVDGGGDVTVNGGNAEFAFEQGESLFNERGLACAWGRNDVDGEDASGFNSSLILLRQTVIGVEDVFDNWYVLSHFDFRFLIDDFRLVIPRLWIQVQTLHRR